MRTLLKAWVIIMAISVLVVLWVVALAVPLWLITYLFDGVMEMAMATIYVIFVATIHLAQLFRYRME